MNYAATILEKKQQLKQEYLQLIEAAYNYRESDDALSDVSEYEATLILNKLNKLKFVVTDTAILT